jgi:hypothetical protein
MHRDAVITTGAELVRFAKSCGLIRGEWIAIDGSKFRAVASIDTVRERVALQRYLDSVEKADTDQDVVCGIICRRYSGIICRTGQNALRN